MRRVFVFSLLLAATGCGSPGTPDNGKQACAPAGSARRCPDGLECRTDNHCWRPGTGPTGNDDGGPDGDTGPVTPPLDGGPPDSPTDMAVPTQSIEIDAALPREAPPFEVTPSRPLPSGNRQVPGGGTASSQTYRMVRTAAPPPGTNVQESQNYRMVGGLIGATQR
jgi:hypothetical protein